MTASDFYKIDWKAKKGPAKVYIYGAIGDWEILGETSARQFAKDLNAIDADQIELHLNSPGGNAWDGVAIYNTIRQHEATTTVYVDGMAASAASIVAMAGDQVIMSPGSQMMIHDPSAVAWGPPAMMRETAAILDKMANSGANIYARKAGGEPAEWRSAMEAESWYMAQEAVDAGLADRLDEEADPKVEQNFDLSRFKFQGRQKAPQPTMIARSQQALRESGTSAQPPTQAAPQTPVPASAATVPQQEKGASMDLAQLREAINASNLDDAAKQAALAALPAVAGAGTPPPASAPEAPAPHQQLPAGVMALDISTVEMLKEHAAAGQEALQRLVRQERDTTIEQAIKDGKFAPARRDHWQKLWDKDPEGTKQYIDGLAVGLLPTQLVGYGQDVTDADEQLYLELFGAPPGGVR